MSVCRARKHSYRAERLNQLAGTGVRSQGTMTLGRAEEDEIGSAVRAWRSRALRLMAL